MNTNKSIGFTLIEILIVIFIISIVSGVALLSISFSEHRRLANFVAELKQSITLAQQEAMLKPAIIRLEFTKHYYQFLYYHPHSSSASPSSWLPLAPPLGKQFYPEGLVLQLKIKGADTPNSSAIIISSSGNLNPFSLYVGKVTTPPQWILTGEEDGSVSERELET